MKKDCKLARNRAAFIAITICAVFLASCDNMNFPTYTVTFDVNAASGGSSVQETVMRGSSMTLPGVGRLSRSGHVFAGWNTDRSGTGTNFHAGVPFTPTGNITLFANWQARSGTGTIDMGPVPGDTLTEQLAWLRTHAQSNGSYIVELSDDETIASCREGWEWQGPPTLPTGRTNLTITLRGTGAVRTVGLSANGVLFTVGSGVTLVLDNNITLVGRNQAAHGANNHGPLVRVSDGGTLVMAGARVTGNTNTSMWDSGGGVRVNSGGAFDMRGGEISGNSAGDASSTGGGVHVASGGTFRISDGIIHGNDAAEGLRNTATGSGSGASLFVASGGTAQSGTFNAAGAFTSLGNLGTVNVTVNAENGVIPFSLAEGTLAERLDWLRGLAQSGGSYVIELSGNETIAPEQTGWNAVPTLPTGRTNLTITLRGTGAVRTVGLSANGVLFTVESGVTLVLDNNITLVGRNQAAHGADNNSHLVRVNNGGTLVMNAGARVTGNTNTSSWENSGGGVRVNSGGTFVMRGGEIAGNSAGNASNTGGGVHVASGGTFRISDGIIHGNDAAEGLRNTATGSGSGAAVFVASDGTAQSGTFNAAGAFTSLGNLVTTNATLNATNGVLQREGTLAQQLAWLRSFAQSGGSYVIELSGNEAIAPQTLPTGRTNLTITLRGTGAVRTVGLSANGVLFTVGSGVTLVLDNNVTLVGRNQAAHGADNDNHLIRVDDGGTLVMNAGARVTGNTNTTTWPGTNIGGGVRVNSGGTFDMHGGEIAGNSAGDASSTGGGVHVDWGGTFRISDGIIHGNDAAEGLRNTAAGSWSGASLFVASGGTAHSGTFNAAGAFTSLGNLDTANVTVNATNGVLQMVGTFAEQLDWLRSFAQSGGSYVIELSGNETIAPEQTGSGAVPTLPTGRTDLTITLRGTGAVRTVGLSANGVLFTVGSGVMLVLDNNITLVGRNQAAHGANNNNHLVRVSDGGTLVMNAGARVTGNTNTSTSSWWDSGGGVRVNSGGTFDMRGGEIADNSVGDASSTGGGVHVDWGGTFRISDGIIHGSDAAEGLRNTATGGGSGASLFVGGTAQHGTFNFAGAFTSLGTLNTSNNTIHMAGGNLAP